ncbi:NUDIX domain-containing protein [Agrobacterium sp.]|jgi:8-oxo-dGTP diphosphatase|uniref:NUDIX hydrolase n=1 Tax=Agrobacterium sp. TaxID=361 RepID=UPI0028A67A1B
MSDDTTREIIISAAILLNEKQEMLVVRKRGTSQFMQPGGKIDAGETPGQALCRELSEEISLDLDESAFSYQGVYREMAANEPGATVVAHAFVAMLNQDVTPQAEIEDARWLPIHGQSPLPLAKLTEFHMLPLARKALGSNTP